MSVEFDFAVANQTYRIIRKYARPKNRSGSGHPLLEFQVKDGERFRSETGDNVTHTQQKITSTLHMDYETFKNSAFLQQGHSDEFTNREPSRRKEVLAAILGLSRYDVLEAKSRESMKIWDDAARGLKVSIDETGSELLQKTAWELKMSFAQEDMARCEELTKQQEVMMYSLREQRDRLAAKTSNKEQLEKQIAETQKAYHTWIRQIEKHKERITQCEEHIGKKDEITAGHERLTAAKKRNDELSAKLSQLVKWNERKNKLELYIERAKGELLREHAVIQRNIKELQAKVG